MEMKLSVFQQAILNEVKNGNTNIAINAVAGSGKTTTIKLCCEELGYKCREVLFLAFNKDIVNDIAKEIGNKAIVRTLHSFGLYILKQQYKLLKEATQEQMEKYIDERKYSRYIRMDIETAVNRGLYSKEDAEDLYDNSCELFDLCRVNLIDRNDIEGIMWVKKHYGIPFAGDSSKPNYGCEVRIVQKYLSVSRELNWQNPVLDYIDMVVIPATTFAGRVKPFKVVFIDECQDLNPAQRALMQAASRFGRFIAVGDRRQAINGFAGASNDSFDQIANLPNTKEMPLSVCYRCDKAMIQLAQAIVPEIEAREGAGEGKVDYLSDLTLDDFHPNDMVLCRKSAPCVTMAMKLIRCNVPAIVKGKKIGAGLKRIVEKSKTSTVRGFKTWSESYLAKLANDLAKAEKITPTEAEKCGKYITEKDKVECILAIGEDKPNLKDVIAHIDTLFTNENTQNAVVFSTAHKSKGLQANRVVILLPTKLPMVWRDQLDWEYEQEMNLRYVALTRAKKELVFVNLEQDQLSALEFKKK